MKILKVAQALAILSEYSQDVTPDYVPETYSNGTPMHPSRMYLKVEVNEEVSDHDANLLKQFGWRSECDGMYWVMYDV